MSAIHNVNPNTLLKWLNAHKAILVDVREAEEYEEEYIDNAINIPLSCFKMENIQYLLKDKHKKLVVQCRSGKRSMVLCKRLIQTKMLRKIWNLDGGIIAWKQAGFPIILS